MKPVVKQDKTPSSKLGKKLLVTLMGLSLGMGAFAAYAEEEKDSAGDRARWRAEWFEEGSSAKIKGNEKHGGRLSAFAIGDSKKKEPCRGARPACGDPSRGPARSPAPGGRGSRP